MTHATRRPVAIVAVTIAAVIGVAACGNAGASPTPSTAAQTTTPTTAVPAATPSASAAASTLPSTAPSGSPATASAPAASALACAMPPAGILPSDRFTGVTAIPGGTADGLRFTFGNTSLPGPASPPMGSISVATPPYTQAGSGEPITMNGQHVLQLRFDTMSIQNDAGEPTYDGPHELTPNLPSIKDVVMYDQSEGVVGWYIGYDGTGCPMLARDGQGLVLTIPHS
jgi:hypothetical protein